jgi:hypothetical protein
MNELDFLSDSDRLHMAYAACVGGSVLIGGAVGRLGSLPGLLAGAATGLAIGLLSCKRLAPAIERKLLSGTERLNDQELVQALRVVRELTGYENKSDAMYLLARARGAMQYLGSELMTQRKTCQIAMVSARQLIEARA